MAVDYGMSIGFEANDLIICPAHGPVHRVSGCHPVRKLGRGGESAKAFTGHRSVFVHHVWGVMMTRKWEFYVLAIFIGCVQGGIQALSRSYYSRPHSQRAVRGVLRLFQHAR